MKLGAMPRPDGVEFAVWAPNANQVDVQIETPAGPSFHRLKRARDGVHAGFVAGAAAGARYRFRLDEGDAFPDPRARFQPEGVHGPSEVVDLAAFPWTDSAWPGVTRDGLVIYELHVGTFTPEGTFAALEGQLAELKSLGVTAIELMPVAAFAGRWNWGYDGVDWFAPSETYGRPEDLQRLVNAAHEHGLAVILDNVYNHFGPDGTYWRAYSDDYFSSKHMTAWGEAINYDGPNAGFVRDFVLDNARQWIADYHVDGLRLDATDTIVDEREPKILREIQEAARAAAPARDVVIIAEDARNDVRLIRPVAQGGFGLDGVWADDFHHELRVYLTNARENYYANYEGSLANVATAINEGFIFQGQPTPATGKPRGTAVTDEPASAFVFCIQNHDQIGNRPFGERLHHDIDRRRFMVASALLLLAPETPLIFMGQEFDASSPFLYFTDHEGELGAKVTEGRRAEFGGFRHFADPRHRAHIPDPQAESTFRRSKLRLDERREHAEIYAFYRELLRLRRDDVVLARSDRRATRAEAGGVHLVTMLRGDGDDLRLLIANFGAATELRLDRFSTADWTPILSSGETRFGGAGMGATIEPPVIAVPARSATLLGGRQRSNSAIT